MNNLKQASTACWLALAGSLTGCGNQGGQEQPAGVATEPVGAPGATSGWELLASGEGTALRVVGAAATAPIHLFCPSKSSRLVVNVPGFDPISSEERMSFGNGDDVVALVADSRGDTLRGGVTAEGEVPAELATILAGSVAASYGAQTVGPFAPASESERRAFLAACRVQEAPPASATPAAATTPITTPQLAPSPKPLAPAKPDTPPKPIALTGTACRTQDGTALTALPLRAIGTEPFWGARIDGRCVTYSTPEDQQGTRVWTKFKPGPDGGTWTGALGGQPFELRTRAAPPPGCSDGMSDSRYPFTVTARVRGETRKGCAARA